MKTIRRGVFETNSSSEHSATVGEQIYVLPKAQYDQFKNGTAFFDSCYEKVVSVKRVFTEFKENKQYQEFVRKNQCRVLNTENFMKLASLEHYWSEDYILKQFKKEKITQFHITKELVGIVREFLEKNSYNIYCRFYEDHSGNDDCDYIEKEVKTSRHTTVVAFGHAWAYCDD